jgi:ABC-type nickel/cobalt efflux system permease component RcnA
VSGPLLALGLTMVYRPAWRRVPAVFALALPATLAAVAFPAIAPLVVQAAIPGCLLSFLAAGLRRVTEPVVPMVAVPQRFDDHDHDHDHEHEHEHEHDDSTRLAAPPSLIVNLDPPAVVRPAPPGRSLS